MVPCGCIPGKKFISLMARLAKVEKYDLIVWLENYIITLHEFFAIFMGFSNINSLFEHFLLLLALDTLRELIDMSVNASKQFSDLRLSVLVVRFLLILSLARDEGDSGERIFVFLIS